MRHLKSAIIDDHNPFVPLDDMAERELQAERQRDESRAGGRERQRRDDRDILGEIASLDRQ